MWANFPSGRFVSLEGEHRDAGAVDALYLHGDTVGLDGVAGLGGTSQGAEYVAAYGVEVLVGQVDLETLVHVDYGDAAVDGIEVVTDLLDGWLAPTISSMMSSMVISPSTLPHSSMTMAICSVRVWNSLSISSMRLFSGTTRHSLIIDLMSKSSAFVRAALNRSLTWAAPRM